jgi:hypothetical protein
MQDIKKPSLPDDPVSGSIDGTGRSAEKHQNNQDRYRKPGQPDCPLQSGYRDTAAIPQEMAPDGKTG